MLILIDKNMFKKFLNLKNILLITSLFVVSLLSVLYYYNQKTFGADFPLLESSDDGPDSLTKINNAFTAINSELSTLSTAVNNIDIETDTNLAVSGNLLNLIGSTLSVNEGTLTDGKYCTYVTGTGLVCDSESMNGTVTSVAMTVPTGLSISGSPITDSGTLALSLSAGYEIPLSTSASNWDTAYGWGDHSGLYDVLGQATSTLNIHTSTYNHDNYDTAYSWGDHSLAGYLDNSLSQGYLFVGNSENDAIATSTIFINSNEYVGIGTTSPAYTLDVYGTARARDLWINGTSTETLRRNLSSGSVVLPELTDNGDGTVTLNDGYYRLFPNDNFTGTINKYFVEGGTTSLTNNDTNYLIIDYNGGNPVFATTTDVSVINESTVIPVYTIERSDNELCILEWNSMGSGLSNKLHFKDLKLNRFERESGIVLGETGTRNLTSTAGIVWNGTKRNNLSAVDTSQVDNDICLFYHSSGVWTKSVTTQYNNTQYDDGTDLQELTVNRYAVNWVFRAVDETKERFCVVLGGGDYTLSQAESSPIPTLPDNIINTCTFIGRVIVQKSSDTAYAIEQVQDISLAYTQISDHNNLNGIQGGLVDEYYHLNASEYIELNEWLDDVILASNGYTTVPNLTVTASTTFNGVEMLFPDTYGTSGYVLKTDGAGTLTWQIDNGTAYTAGNSLTLDGTTFNVDDDFIKNTGDTASGDYTFDSGTLQIDSTNDRIGVSTSTPFEELSVVGQLFVDGSDTSTSTIQGNIEFMEDDGSHGCYFVFGATTTLECY